VTIDLRKEVRRVADLEGRMPRAVRLKRRDTFGSALEYSTAV
jgi:hypothetical protein